MKDLNIYVTEKLRINKDSNIKYPLDKVFKNIYELVDALNSYFDNLKKPIKVIKTETLFKPIGPYNKDGLYVNDHFMIEFSNSPTKIRFGYNSKYGLTMQFIYRDGDKPSYGYMRKFDAYKFGEDNFLDWLKNPNEKNTKRPIMNYFGIEEEL